MEEINKFLTKAMGNCYHDWEMTSDTPPFRTYDCKSCGIGPSVNPSDNTDFLTWEGFGKLWEWAEGELWWCRFLDRLEGPLSYYINPEKFAKAVADYLQKK
jgi:hypothetical protein